MSELFKTGSIRVFVVSVIRVASWIMFVRSQFSMMSLIQKSRHSSHQQLGIYWKYQMLYRLTIETCPRRAYRC